MKIYNPTQITASDYPQDMQQTIEMLGNVLNPFMQQVYELSEGRIDFENTVNNIKNIEIIVDSNGVPVQGSQFQAGKSGIRGFQVINAYNITNSAISATAQPFIAKYTNSSGGLIEIQKITGLVADNKFRLTILIY